MRVVCSFCRLLAGFPSFLALAWRWIPGAIADMSSVGSVESNVAYTYGSCNCQMPPAEVRLPGVIVGSFIWRGLSPASNVEWLLWRRVTHVLNCMGSVDSSSGNTELNYALVVAAGSFHIEYIDWCTTHDASRQNYVDIFSRLERILKHSGSCKYVHCKFGRDCKSRRCTPCCVCSMGCRAMMSGLLCNSELAGTNGLWQKFGTSMTFRVGLMRFCRNDRWSSV